MQVRLNVPISKAKFWPPLQDIHCHGNQLSYGKAVESKENHVWRHFGEGPMEKPKKPWKKKMTVDCGIQNIHEQFICMKLHEFIDWKRSIRRHFR